MGKRMNLGIPKGEKIWTQYYNSNQELMFIVTSKEYSRDFYYLYRIEDGTLKKVGKARSPIDLEDKYDIEKKVGAAK